MDIPLKRMVLEPKLYALMVESARGQVLHLGVHFSLEEAYAAARQRMEMLAPHSQGEAMDIDLWNAMSARQVIGQLMDPSWTNELLKNPAEPKNEIVAAINNGDISQGLGALITSFSSTPRKVEETPPVISETIPLTVNDHVRDIKKKKNLLMKRLIKEGDESQVIKLKSILGPNSSRYVLTAILDKKNKL